MSSNPAKDSRFLRAIRNSSMTYFGVEVKQAVLYHNILQHVEDPYSLEEKLVGKIHGHFSSFSCFATRCLLVTARELWWMNQE
jgi:hypothetical protein